MEKLLRLKARLEEQYVSKIRPQLQQDLQLNNVMEVPKLRKIVLNIGVKDAISDSKVLVSVMNILEKIAGQKPVRTIARKSIAGFKLREGMPIGAKVTLRKRVMYEFLDRLINLALPKMRDFQGVSTRLDGRGSYNLGIKDLIIFPEVDYDLTQKTYGLNITIHMSSTNDKHGFALLKSFGMPFKKA